MHPTWKSVLLTALKFAIPAAIIGFLVYRIDQGKWDELSSQPKDFRLLAAALLVALTAMSLSFARWCLLVRCQGIELTMVEAFRLGAICFLLSFVSAGSVGGDLFKAIFLAQRRPGKRVEAVASVLVDRCVGLYGLLLLVSAAMLLTDPAADGAGLIPMGQIKLATVVLVGLGTVVLAFLILGGRSVDRLIGWGRTWPWVGRLVDRVGPPLRAFHRHPFAVGVAILMSLGIHSMLVASMYLIARGLYSEPPTLAEHFVIVPIGMLVSALPLTPAGLGLLEAAIDELYQFIPAKTTEASGTLVALVFEIVKLVMAIIGTVFYWTANEEVRHSLEIAEEETHPSQ
ncbi:MAG: flippase-like domain-containing protein [Pirellulales bacterium]|nr:flippase-like domain-containing protein [Pirellulales bacterium]